jgi:hypothetical protein
MPTQVPVLVNKEAVAKRIIDMDRYPIAEKNSGTYKALVAKCREQLKELGACVLPGFINTTGVKELAEEANRLAPTAYHSEVTGNAYLTEIEKDWNKDDPRTITDTTALGVIAYDQIPASSSLRAIYEWDTLMEFLADALGKEKLFRYADPMGALNIATMKNGDYLRWHFDQTDFVTTILLQSGEGGGEYEFVPMIRNKINENYGQVKAILQGSREGVIKLDIDPGSLVLFEGRNSLHRVTRVAGDKLRLIALLGFDTKPGTQSSDYLRRIRYGRTEGTQTP